MQRHKVYRELTNAYLDRTEIMFAECPAPAGLHITVGPDTTVPPCGALLQTKSNCKRQTLK